MKFICWDWFWCVCVSECVSVYEYVCQRNKCDGRLHEVSFSHVVILLCFFNVLQLSLRCIRDGLRNFLLGFIRLNLFWFECIGYYGVFKNQVLNVNVHMGQLCFTQYFQFILFLSLSLSFACMSLMFSICVLLCESGGKL